MVVVFVTSFVLLLAIRPPFIYTKPGKSKFESEVVSPGKAALYAFGMTVIAAITMAVVYVVMKNKQNGLKT